MRRHWCRCWRIQQILHTLMILSRQGLRHDALAQAAFLGFTFKQRPKNMTLAPLGILSFVFFMSGADFSVPGFRFDVGRSLFGSGSTEGSHSVSLVSSFPLQSEYRQPCPELSLPSLALRLCLDRPALNQGWNCLARASPFFSSPTRSRHVQILVFSC
jgi:hypothetical protein